MATEKLWKTFSATFPILNEKVSNETVTEDVFKSSVSKLKDLKIDQILVQHIIAQMEEHIRKHVAPIFWSKFQYETSENNLSRHFQEAVTFLYNFVQSFNLQVQRLDYVRKSCNNLKPIYGEFETVEAFLLILRATLFSQKLVDYEYVVHDFYDKAFKVFANSDTVPEDSLDDICCPGCSMELDLCVCEMIIRDFQYVNNCLLSMGLLEKLAGQVITNLIQERITMHIKNTTKGSFDLSHIKTLEEWLNQIVVSWLIRMYCGGSAENPNNSGIAKVVGRFKHKLERFLYETYTNTRIDQLFNIIIEYPESQPAIEDLKHCLPKTELRSKLVSTLQNALQTRLLHPGANTPDILTAYISAIKALRHLDSSGVLLETITEPVRQYLRSRDDTIRCVVQSLTDGDGTGELADELARPAVDVAVGTSRLAPVSLAQVTAFATGESRTQSAPTPGAAGAAGAFNTASPPAPSVEMSDEIVNWETWQPDPVDADPSKSSTVRRTSDIITMLVDIYGSKELFVNEYRTLLADRLLTRLSPKYDIEREIRNLELLKIRFGDGQLHNCEVMLKDISDSKRINTHIHRDKMYCDEEVFPTQATIVSAQFWPPFKEEAIELPSVIKNQMENFTKAYEAHKVNRTLIWKPNLGQVNLDIQLTDKTMNLTVSTVHAAIIIHFQDKDQWQLDELSAIMKLPQTVLRRKLSFWQSQGLIRENTSDIFQLTEKNSNEPESHTVVTHEEYEEAESAMASTSDQREEELQVFWSYIVGMLTNLDSMPLERIHQMLKMFASQGPAVECSLPELRHFLDRQVRDHKLVLMSGLYRLPKG